MRADLESCRSGRTGRIRNPLYPQGYPGFESLALRQLKQKPCKKQGFFVSGVQYRHFGRLWSEVPLSFAPSIWPLTWRAKYGWVYLIEVNRSSVQADFATS